MTTLSQTPPITAPPGTVCKRCWHGLKGLEYGSVCPECGESIGAGMDPLWWGNKPTPAVRRTWRAARTAAWLIAVGIGLFILGAMLAPKTPTGAVTLTDGFALVASFAACSLLFGGIWVAVGTLPPLGFAPPWLAVCTRAGALATTLGHLTTSLLSLNTMQYPRALSAGQLVFAACSVSTLILWSAALRRTARMLGPGVVRGWSLAQLCAACAIAVCWAPTALFTLSVLISNTMPPGWIIGALRIVGYAAAPLTLAFAATLVTNPILLNKSLGRFLDAREGAQ